MFEQEVKKLLKSVGVKETIFEIPPQKDFGDVAFPCFQLAKPQKRNPAEIANEIAGKLKVKDTIFSKIESKGPYVNFFFDWKKISERILKQIVKTKIDFGKGKKVMVEYSQPNTAHGLHIGHARATMLGESLCRILKLCGYNVIKTNYYGDFGVQMSKSIVAYMKWGKGTKIDKKQDLWMWDLYVKFHDESKTNQNLEEEAREVLRKLENKDNEIIKLWKEIRNLVLEGIKQTYKRLGVSFDVELFESEYFNLGRDIVEAALNKGIAQKSEGAIITNLEKYGLSNAVLIKSDGTTTYQTRDLGLAVKNFKDYKLDSRIYVVDVRQSLHFKQLFRTLELLVYSWAKNLHHLAFGFVNLPEGLMASRSGRAVALDEFLDELRDLAYIEVEKRNPDIDKNSKMNIAEKIATGALIFALLKIEPDQNIVFNKEDIIQFEGDTGPYVQYAHTRCLGILKKTGKWKPKYSADELSEQEKELLKTLSRFTEVLEHSAKEMRPHLVCNYAYELATTLASFYEKCPVLKAEKDVKNFRLTLVDATRNVLRISLNLIGIEVPEKM